MALKIYNSLSAKREAFQPLDPPRVRIYNCGITPHDVSHLGHGSAALRTAMVRRYLAYLGYDVIFVQNVTDVDDKIIARSRNTGRDVCELAHHYTDEFNACLRDLGVEPPRHEPKVSEYVGKIIAYVQALITKGAAYATSSGDVYFDVSRKADYGKLSRRKLDELITGTRDINEGDKRSPADFALWKADDTPGASWPSPWGKGRPGWHIECSVMSNDLLGKHFDIHCGGLDLVFPHHENELAQCEAHNDCPFVNVWMHVGLLNVEGAKMSKSLGNFVTLRAGIEKYGAELLSFVTAKHHYRSPIDFADRLFHESLNNLCEFYVLFDELAPGLRAPSPSPIRQLDEAFRAEMDEDLNSPRALTVLLSALREARSAPPEQRASVAGRVRALGGILGLFRPEYDLGSVRDAALRFQTSYLQRPTLTSADVDAAIARRAEARRQRDWKTSDQVRDELLLSGVTLCDAPNAPTTWQFSVMPA